MRELINSAAIYVLVNVAASAVTFSRNILFMRNLDHGDLGEVAIIQTIVVIVGFFQFGLINGGYRLFVGADPTVAAQINNTITTNLGGLSLLFLPVISMLQSLGEIGVKNIQNETLLIGSVIGVATMWANWLNNTLIAKFNLTVSASINLCSIVLSLVVVLLSEPGRLEAAFLAMLVQPVCAIIVTLTFNDSLRPRISINRKLTRKIIVLGFAPYCAGIITLMNLQLERWFIVSELGAEAMGKYYLTIIYSSVFMLVPLSLLNLFYPKAATAFELRDKNLFKYLVQKHRLVLVIYLCIASVVTFSFLPWSLKTYLNKYAGQQNLVYLVLPGLIAIVLFDNVALILQSSKKMFNIFLFTLVSIALNCSLLMWATAVGNLTLEFAATIKSLSCVIAALAVTIVVYLRRGLLE
jgi:O-antigen/teichoic acid export membrane protein